MKTYTDHSPKSHQLSLFDWRPVVVNPSLAALKLSRRFGISIAHAVTVASLAGLGDRSAK